MESLVKAVFLVSLILPPVVVAAGIVAVLAQSFVYWRSDARRSADARSSADIHHQHVVS